MAGVLLAFISATAVRHMAPWCAFRAGELLREYGRIRRHARAFQARGHVIRHGGTDGLPRRVAEQAGAQPGRADGIGLVWYKLLACFIAAHRHGKREPEEQTKQSSTRTLQRAALGLVLLRRSGVWRSAHAVAKLSARKQNRPNDEQGDPIGTDDGSDNRFKRSGKECVMSDQRNCPNSPRRSIPARRGPSGPGASSGLSSLSGLRWA